MIQVKYKFIEKVSSGGPPNHKVVKRFFRDDIDPDELQKIIDDFIGDDKAGYRSEFSYRIRRF